MLFLVLFALLACSFFVFGLVLSFFFVSFSFFVCYAFLFWGVERQVLEDVSVIMEFSLR